MRIEPQGRLVNEISAALTVASVQHRIVANNIANASTPSFSRQMLAVAPDSISKLASRAFETGEPLSRLVMAEVKVVPAPDSPASGIETDLLDLSVNTMRYSTLSRVLARYFSIASAVASGNKV